MGIGYPGAPIEFALAGLDRGSDPDPIQSNEITDLVIIAWVSLLLNVTYQRISLALSSSLPARPALVLLSSSLFSSPESLHFLARFPQNDCFLSFISKAVSQIIPRQITCNNSVREPSEK